MDFPTFCILAVLYLSGVAVNYAIFFTVLFPEKDYEEVPDANRKFLFAVFLACFFSWPGTVLAGFLFGMAWFFTPELKQAAEKKEKEEEEVKTN